MLTIGRLEPSDRAQWEVLFRAYMDFYKRTLPQAMYDRAAQSVNGEDLKRILDRSAQRSEA